MTSSKLWAFGMVTNEVFCPSMQDAFVSHMSVFPYSSWSCMCYQTKQSEFATNKD